MSNDKSLWFTNVNGQITGPYSKEQVEKQISTWQPKQNEIFLVWGRGMSEWVNPILWKQFLNQDAQAEEKQKEAQWKYRINSEQEQGPLVYTELINALKTIEDLSSIEIWSEEKAEWYSIFKNKRLVDDLGVTRRKHPRVPITGTVDIEIDENSVHKATIVSISEGGIGITNAQNLIVGHRYKLGIKSPNLYSPINSSVDVVYIGEDGYCGMKFHQLTAEARSIIIEYVRHFGETNQ